MVLRLSVFLLFACLFSRASDNPNEILRRIDAKVLGHLAKAVNYTCVETVDRQYFTPVVPEGASCNQNPHRLKLARALGLRLAARDRLRLDVAVSGGNEMYSWHAAHKFSSTLIDRIVREGPIGSGGFVGFLENIFGTRGVRFRYEGRQTKGTAGVFAFEYAVPLPASHYVIEGKHRKAVPFHGSFLAYTSNYELASMTLIADEIPNAVGICASRNWIGYQLVTVAGNELLLPKEWTLGLTTPALSTTSRSKYTECREFAGQATISYKNLVSGPAADIQPLLPPQELPAKLRLKIRLLTPISGEHSSAGDPVRGKLLRRIVIGRRGRQIPRGAILDGVITRLEQSYEPSIYYLLDIEFNSMRSGNRTFILRARPKPTPKQTANLRSIYPSGVPPGLLRQVKHGVFVFASKQLTLRKHFSAEWVTEPFSGSQ